MWWRLALWSLLPAMVTAAPAAVECAGCHPAEVRLHSGTRMANAMVPALESAFSRNVLQRPLRESADGYFMSYRQVQNGLAVVAFRGTDRAEGFIEWVIGAGAQGQTPLVSAANGTLESRVSYFPRLQRYGVTIGQHAGASLNAKAALGLRQNNRDLQSCIGCHSTAITGDLKPVIPGVQCGRCHLGADEHARGHGIPSNPGKMAAPEQVRFCGNCHRVKPPVDDAQLENVRFQPFRLMKSRCFSGGLLACTTCHPAHQDARRNDPVFYNEKCHACHDGRAMHVDQRRQGDCIGCHMPYVQLHPALKFTDHFIRVVKPGDLPAEVIRQRGIGS